MIEKLALLEKRYVEIEEKLSDANIISDIEAYKKYSKEYKQLTPIVEKYREYTKAEAEIEDSDKILATEKDPEIRELAVEQKEAAKEAKERIIEELKVLLLPKDPNDDKNVIVEIRSGAGGEEAALFAAVLYRMYTMYAESAGYKTELLYANETELGGFKEISFMIEGEGAYSRFKFEGGVHRVQRVPETEAQGRIHTSTVTVAVLPEVDDEEFELNMDELEITRHHSSGAGGQNVNKVETAIRIVHKPTGIVVDCQDERSQLKNREKALKIMKSRLADMERQKKEQALANERRSQVGTGDRSERIRTYNYPQGRVTDHRIGLTLYSLDSFLNGEIDEMIDALIAADRAEKLKAGEGI
ncbi:MAG TPA: peptide chain release factor 1 [Bacillota bacterium]|nr:peptide chain release factor 1 [Bacillota bacterium]HOK68625.1 peptide chain release factor 1 [Bacillota bacterium]HPP84737.1 peptide chain release factor 1 [Bacillota bacterium]